MSKVLVLDSSAMLAALLDEPGGERLEAADEPLIASTVNMTETRTRLFDLGYAKEEVESSIRLLNVREVDFTRAQSIAASALRPATRAAGLSLGDRACLALAEQFGATALTADRQWKTIALPVAVELIR